MRYQYQQKLPSQTSQQNQPFPRIQRLNEDVESNAAAALQMATSNKKASTPFAIQYNLNNSSNNNGDTKSIFSEVSRRSGLSLASSVHGLRGLGKQEQQPQSSEAQKADQDSNNGQQPQQQQVENGPAAGLEALPEEASEENRAELYDEINSLYNMENPKGDDYDEKASQYSK